MKLNKIAIKNIFQMGSIQVVNYLFPIITVPYLLRTIGFENYGTISVQIAIVQILLIISDYGFNFTATKRIAIKGNIDNELASIIYIFKLCMSFFIFVIYLFISVYNSYNFEQNFFYFGFFLFFLFQSMIPVWLFRGLNKLGVISFINIISKVLSLILILSLIQSKDDYYFMGIAYFIPTFITCIITQFIGFKLGLKFEKVKLGDIVNVILDGKDIFISNATGILYTSLNIVIVSFFGGNYAAGIYSVCEKIVGLVNSVTNAVSQAVYPIVCKKIAETSKAMDQFKISLKYFGWWTICTFIGGGVIFLFSPFVLEIVTGENHSSMQVLTLKLMSFIPFLISLGHLLGIQTLIPLNLQVKVRNAVTLGAIINTSLGILLSYLFHAPGTAIAIFICELVVVLKEFMSIREYIGKEKGLSKIEKIV